MKLIYNFFYILFFLLVFNTASIKAETLEDLNNKSLNFLKYGNIVEADKYVEKIKKQISLSDSILSNKKSIQYFLTIAKIKYAYFEYEESVSYINKINDIKKENILKNNTDYEIYLLQAKLYYKQGKYDESIEILNNLESKSKEINEFDDIFLFNLNMAIAEYYRIIFQPDLSEYYLIKIADILKQNNFDYIYEIRHLLALTEVYIYLSKDNIVQNNIKILKNIANTKTYSMYYERFQILYLDALFHHESVLVSSSKKTRDKFVIALNYGEKYFNRKQILIPLLIKTAQAYAVLSMSDDDYYQAIRYLGTSFSISSYDPSDSAMALITLGLISLKKKLEDPSFTGMKYGVGASIKIKKKDENFILIESIISEEQKNLRKGDKITHINSNSVFNLKHNQVISLLTSSNQSKVHLTIDRNDQIFEIKIDRVLIDGYEEGIEKIIELALCDDNQSALAMLKYSYGELSSDYLSIQALGSCGAYHTVLGGNYALADKMYFESLKRMSIYLSNANIGDIKNIYETTAISDFKFILGVYMIQIGGILFGDINTDFSEEEKNLMRAKWIIAHQIFMQSKVRDSINFMNMREKINDKKLIEIIEEKRNNSSKLAKLKKSYRKIYKNNNSDNIGNVEKDIIYFTNENQKLKLLLDTEFSNFVEYNSNAVLSDNSFIQLIKPNEKIIMISSILNDGLVGLSAIDQNGFSLGISTISKKDLKNSILKIRAATDLNLADDQMNLKNFPFDESYNLFKLLTGADIWRKDFLKDGDKLIFIVEPDLLDIPFWALTTSSYKNLDGFDTASILDLSNKTIDLLKKAPWIAKKYSVSLLPSLKSFRILRETKNNNESLTFVGFGDPKINKLDENSSKSFVSIFNNFFTKGGEIDTDKLRNLPEIPDTQKELKEMKKYFSKNNSQIFFRDQANEEFIKNFDFTKTDIIAFSTHALIAGEIRGLNEPGLVFSIPDTPTKENDGYLTASEITNLNLNANMVILSACNTSSGLNYNSEPLTGLVKSFFYAGAKSLLISNWKVEAESSAFLTTGMLKIITEKNVSNSEALRISILELMNNNNKNYFSHPAFWAPFNLISD